MQIGYTRVSTSGQNSDGQQDALIGAGCEKVFSDVASGARADRPALQELLEFARPGDTIVVTKLDRLARSVVHLTTLVSELEERSIGFKSLSESLDTNTPGGTLLFHIMSAIAQFERDLIRERTSVGLAAARKRGRVGGRPRKMTQSKLEAGRSLLNEGMSARDVASTIGVSVATLYRHLPAVT